LEWRPRLTVGILAQMPEPWEREMVGKNGAPLLRDLVKNPDPGAFSTLGRSALH